MNKMTEGIIAVALYAMFIGMIVGVLAINLMDSGVAPDNTYAYRIEFFDIQQSGSMACEPTDEGMFCEGDHGLKLDCAIEAERISCVGNATPTKVFLFDGVITDGEIVDSVTGDIFHALKY